MNNKLILGSTILTCAVACYFLFSQNQTELVQENKVLVQEPVKKVNASVSTDIITDNTLSKASSLQQKKTAEQLIADAQDSDIITKSIEKTTSMDEPSDMDEQLTQIVALFPQLKEEVEEYRQDLNTQYRNLASYQQHIKERNQQLTLGGVISESEEYKFDYEKDRLLEEAKVLGKKAMELNESIREAAYNG